MKAKREILFEGRDHTDMLTLFRSMVLKSGAGKGDPLIWAGCEGPCYSMATFFTYGLRDLRLGFYFATDADMDRLWRLELQRGLGFLAAGRQDPLKAKVLVLMSGLLKAPFENVLRISREGLREDGVIIGETVVRGLFEQAGWYEKVPMRYVFEFSMLNPTVLEVKERS